MKFNIESKALFKYLDLVSKAVPKNSFLPILKMVKFESAPSGLNLYATNLDGSIVIRGIPIVYEVSGSICIPLQALKNLKGLTGEYLQVSLDNSTVTFSSDEVSLQVEGVSSEDFPDIEINDLGAEDFSLSIQMVKEIQKYFTPLCLDESDKTKSSSLCGVMLTINSSGGYVVASNGAVFWKKKIELTNVNRFFNQISIPKYFWSWLNSMEFSEIGIYIEPTEDSSRIVAKHRSSEVEVFIKALLFDGSYVDCEALISYFREGRVIILHSEFVKMILSGSNKKTSSTITLSSMEPNSRRDIQFSWVGFTGLAGESFKDKRIEMLLDSYFLKLLLSDCSIKDECFLSFNCEHVPLQSMIKIEKNRSQTSDDIRFIMPKLK